MDCANYGSTEADFDLELQYPNYNNFTKVHNDISLNFDKSIGKSTGRTKISTTFVQRFREEMDRFCKFLEDNCHTANVLFWYVVVVSVFVFILP